MSTLCCYGMRPVTTPRGTNLKKGWECIKNPDGDRKIIQRKSTGQTVRNESHGMPSHYHWLDYWERPMVNSHYRKFKNREYGGGKVYYNKYGELTHQGDPLHHIDGHEK